MKSLINFINERAGSNNMWDSTFIDGYDKDDLIKILKKDNFEQLLDIEEDKLTKIQNIKNNQDVYIAEFNYGNSYSFKINKYKFSNVSKDSRNDNLIHFEIKTSEHLIGNINVHDWGYKYFDSVSGDRGNLKLFTVNLDIVKEWQKTALELLNKKFKKITDELKANIGEIN